MIVETRWWGEKREFNRLVSDNQERARESYREGYRLLRLILVLFAGTIAVWYFAPKIAKIDVEESLEAVQESTSTQAESPLIDFYDIARCGRGFFAVGDRGLILNSTLNSTEDGMS